LTANKHTNKIKIEKNNYFATEINGIEYAENVPSMKCQIWFDSPETESSTFKN
jgi:hypothetical protein